MIRLPNPTLGPEFDLETATSPGIRAALDVCQRRRDLWDGVCVELEEALEEREDDTEDGVVDAGSFRFWGCEACGSRMLPGGNFREYPCERCGAVMGWYWLQCPQRHKLSAPEESPAPAGTDGADPTADGPDVRPSAVADSGERPPPATGQPAGSEDPAGPRLGGKTSTKGGSGDHHRDAPERPTEGPIYSHDAQPPTGPAVGEAAAGGPRLGPQRWEDLSVEDRAEIRRRERSEASPWPGETDLDERRAR
jgi:predicted RNA-binding Zn-ribbon protein involved in translation (DUF1610 family)